MTGLTVWNTVHNRGPFAGELSGFARVLIVQSFVAVFATTYLVVAAVVRERRKLGNSAKQSESRWRELFDHMEEHVFSADLNGRFLQVNRACREALGYTEAEMLSLTVFQILHLEELVAWLGTMKRQWAGEKIRIVEGRILTKSGKVIEVEGNTELHFEQGVPVYLLSIFRDVTDRKRRERELETYRKLLEEANARLETLAAKDGLTGLNNRRTLQEQMTHQLKRAMRNGSPLSLLLLDVDDFKAFNDTFGHPAGDSTLQAVARLLADNARDTDFVARFGGEEFAVLLPDTGRDEALMIAERFRQSLEMTNWSQRDITVSVGVATLNDPHGCESMLVDQADAALYHSKRTGRNCVHHANQIQLAASC